MNPYINTDDSYFDWMRELNARIDRSEEQEPRRCRPLPPPRRARFVRARRWRHWFDVPGGRS